MTAIGSRHAAQHDRSDAFCDRSIAGLVHVKHVHEHRLFECIENAAEVVDPFFWPRGHRRAIHPAGECAQGADALVIVTEWEQFRALDLGTLKRVMARPVVVDLRNIYRPDDMAARGFVYVSVGRATVAAEAASEAAQ